MTGIGQFPTVGEVGTTTSFDGSGTLVSGIHVLTAAHVVCDNAGGLTNPVTDYRFRLNNTIYSTRDVIVHPTYRGFRGQTENQFDIAVLVLSSPVPNIVPSPLLRRAPVLGEVVTLVGYGALGTGTQGEFRNPRMFPPFGSIAFGNTPIDVITPTFIKWDFNNVTGPGKESNTAPGDSGGPSFVTEGSTLTVAGVCSGGDSAGVGNGGVGFGERSFNTRVDVILSFLDPIIQSFQGGSGGGGSGGGGGGAVSGPRPDIQVTALTFPPNPIVGTPFTLTARVVNSGSVTATGLFVSAFLDQPTPTSSSAGAAQTLPVNNLLPGGFVDVVFSLTYATSGTFTLSVLGEADNLILENSETNNTFSQKVDVFARGVDLLIQKITKIEAVPGRDATFTVTVQNRGATASGAFNLGFYNNRFAAPTRSDVPDQTKPLTSLGSGATADFVFVLPTQPVARGGRSWFFADHNNTVAEDIETNNTDSLTWGVRNNPVVVTSQLSASTPVVTIGQPVSFTAGASDPDGDTITYFWEFGDGLTEVTTGPSVLHIYTVPGIYTVRVTITDGPFSSAVLTFTVEVIDSQFIDLGTVSLSGTRGRVQFSGVLLPSVFGTRDRPKATILTGNPGTRARLANTRFRALVTTTGVYRFTVLYLLKKTGVSRKVTYQYTVVN